MQVVYYKNATFEHIGKRMIKVTATLEMISERRGKVIAVKIRPMDSTNKISPDYMKILVQKELGTLKNIKACYSVES